MRPLDRLRGPVAYARMAVLRTAREEHNKSYTVPWHSALCSINLCIFPLCVAEEARALWKHSVVRSLLGEYVDYSTKSSLGWPFATGS